MTTRRTTWMALLALGGAMLLPAADAHAQFRWPWERRDKTEQKEDTEERTKPERPGQRDRGRPEELKDEAFLNDLHRMAAEQLRLAELALEKDDAAEVHDFARTARDDYRNWIQVVERRADELGVELTEGGAETLLERVRGRDIETHGELAEKSGASFQVAYLDETMENIDQIRDRFHGYRELESDTEFRETLTEMFDDDLVEHRSDAKELHDEIRNEARREGRLGGEEDE